MNILLLTTAFVFAADGITVPSAQRGDPERAQPEDEVLMCTECDPGWQSDVRLLTLMNMFGFRPVQVVSLDGKTHVEGSELEPLQAQFRIRGRVKGEVFHWQFEPYTDVPRSTGNGYHINTAGLETSILTPVRDWLRLGLYHHSSHNVADGTYGFGIDLNAVVADAVVIDSAMSSAPFSGSHRMRVVTHYYIRDKGSPWVLTEDATVRSSETGKMKYRFGVDYEIANDSMGGECKAFFLASRKTMASAAFDCFGGWIPGSQFLGDFGEHIQVGPYLSYRQNLTRFKAFGNRSFIGGVRIDILVHKNGAFGPIFW